ncbi:MAG: hypothetical protein M3R29_04560 [Verrucomicrobiota bacterium]|nr:hypothetical protein [Verrucomicrobiota bacterium]
MKNLIAVLLCLSLVEFTVSRAATPSRSLAATAKTMQKKPSGKKADAKTLLADAKKSLATMIKAARADKGLDPKTAKNKPFWKATQKIAKELKRAEKGLADKNNDFFDAINDARTAEAQLKVDWQLTDSKNKTVIDSAKKLGHAIAILRTDFSKEAARKKKGGALTDKEKAEFEKIKARQKDLLAKIDKLKAKASKDKALVYGLQEIEKNAKRVADAPVTLDAFLAALYAIDEIEGLLYGYDYYVDKSWRADWIVVDTYFTSWETIYDEFVSVETYDWAVVDVPVDIDIGEEVDVAADVSDSDIQAQDNFAENEPFDMSDAEEDQVAEEEDTDAEVDSDDSDDDDSMDDASDDDGEDFDGDGDDDGGDMGDDGGDDDGGDDGGGDDGGGDDGD